jgi:4a-hydroxytetrahydrobiopterin dehydratase
MMGQLEGWESFDGRIEREFRFKNYYQTMAFVNAVAWIANRENHHPAMQVGYNICRVSYTTHAIDGLSENDFICAAKVEALLSD